MLIALSRLLTPPLGLACRVLLAGVAVAAAPEDEAPVYRVTRRPFEVGERYEVSTVLSTRLSAEVGIGFLAQTLNYDAREEERLEISVLEPEDGELGRRGIAYPVRRNTSVAPFVGKKTRERRVHGKSYVLSATPTGPVVRNPDGGETREKEAAYVRASWHGLGLQPVSFAFLPPGATVELRKGQELTVDGETAKRLLGLPFDELQVESVTLKVEGEGPDGTIACQASAVLGGSTELSSAKVVLDATLEGPLLLDPATGRVTRLDMTGHATFSGESEEALFNGSGEGDLELRRMIRPLDG